MTDKAIDKHWKKLANLKISQLKSYLKTRIFPENNLVHYTNPVSFNTLVTSLKLDQITSLAYLKTIAPAKIANLDLPLDEETMQTLLLHFNFDFLRYQMSDFYDYLQKFATPYQPQKLVTRSLVVAMMGHVDHGKTTLLDTLRHSQLTAQETGAITQKIGGYQINHRGQKLTFLDTPGHQLFAQMRAQGARITDLIILVIAGDEGVKPQTVEAIEHAQKAQVPIVVFVNKMDLATSKLEKVEKSLINYHLVSQSLGGPTKVVAGSCKKNQGITMLLDVLLSQAKTDINLKANITLPAKATIIDSFLTKQGRAISLLIERGIVKIQSFFFTSGFSGKVKRINDENGKSLSQALPGDFVTINGFDQVLPSGSQIYFFPEEKIIKTLIKDFFAQKLAKPSTTLSERRATALANFTQSSSENKPKEINLVIKFASKAIEEIFKKKMNQFQTSEVSCQLNFLHFETGPITFNDYHLAYTNQADILTFALKPHSFFTKKSQADGMMIKNFDLLHDFFSYLSALTKGENLSLFREKVLAVAKIVKVFSHSKYGKIAGCILKEGTISLSKMKVKILRNEQEIARDLTIKSLKQEKKDITLLSAPQECGIILYRFSDFLIGDQLIQYQMVKKDEKKL